MMDDGRDCWRNLPSFPDVLGKKCRPNPLSTSDVLLKESRHFERMLHATLYALRSTLYAARYALRSTLYAARYAPCSTLRATLRTALHSTFRYTMRYAVLSRYASAHDATMQVSAMMPPITSDSPL